MRVLGMAILLCLFAFPTLADDAGSFDYYDASSCISPDGEPVSEARLDRAREHVETRTGEGAFGTLQDDPRKQIILCRILGLQTPAWKQHWPSVTEPVRYHFSQEISAEEAAALSDYLTNWYLTFSNQIGVAVTHPVVVISGLSREGIFSKIEDHGPLNYERADFYSAYAVSCAGSDRPEGFSVYNFVILCLPEDGLTEQMEAPYLVETFLHEAFHVIQYQLLGQPPNGTDAERLDAFGPEWLLEGSADHLSLSTVYREDVFRAKIGELARAAKADPAPLETYEEFQSQGLAGYERALLRTHALVAATSKDRLFALYSDLGFGADWKDAFQRAFETKPDTIYETDFREFQ